MILSGIILASLIIVKPGYECTRWSWTSDGYTKQVICLEQRKKDCSNKLYPEICKL